MAAQRSFTEYVKKRFDNNFWEAADCLPSWRVLHSRKASPYHRMSSWDFSTAISRDRLL